MTDEQNVALLLERKPEAHSESSLTTPIQSATENPRVEFRQGQFVFCMTNEAGGLVERFISAAQVRQAFTGLPVESGWLPPGIMRYGNGTLGEWAIAFIPPKVHELEITREIATSEVDRIRVPLPGLVWFGLSTTYFIWAVKTPQLEPYQEIYRVPLPNTYADGSICWGLVKPERMTAATIFKAYDLFMGTTFNNHLANGKSRQHREDVRVKLRDLAVPSDAAPGSAHEAAQLVALTTATYPVDDLMRQIDHTGISLDAAIRTYFQTGVMPS